MSVPKRQLGVLVASAIVVANMIGAGVFTTAGFQALALHDPITMLLTWVVGGVLALCGAACYAELGALMPRAGGEYVYLREAFHPIVGFLSGWVSLTAGFSAPIAAAALAFAAYLSSAGLGLDPLTQKLVAAALVLAVTALHAFDARIGGRVQAGFTIAKVALITFFIVAGVLVGHGSWFRLAPAAPGLGHVFTQSGAAAFAGSLMYVSFAYSGWNAAAYIAGEIEEPQRTLPRALLIGTGIVMVLYVALNAVFLYAVAPSAMAPWDANCEPGTIGGCPHPVVEVGTLAARALFGHSAGSLLATLIAIGLVSAVSAMVMAGPRVYAAMAEDGALPAVLGTRNARGVPSTAVIAQSVLALVFVFVGDLKGLIEFVSFTLWIFAALTVVSVFVFRRRGLVSPYRALGYPLTPILFAALSVWVIYQRFNSARLQSLMVLGLLGVGAVIYAIMPRTAKAASESQAPPADGV